jgi:hypothetical protein
MRILRTILAAATVEGRPAVDDRPAVAPHVSSVKAVRLAPWRAANVHAHRRSLTSRQLRKDGRGGGAPGAWRLPKRGSSMMPMGKGPGALKLDLAVTDLRCLKRNAWRRVAFPSRPVPPLALRALATASNSPNSRARLRSLSNACMCPL